MRRDGLDGGGLCGRVDSVDSQVRVPCRQMQPGKPAELQPNPRGLDTSTPQATHWHPGTHFGSLAPGTPWPWTAVNCSRQTISLTGRSRGARPLLAWRECGRGVGVMGWFVAWGWERRESCGRPLAGLAQLAGLGVLVCVVWQQRATSGRCVALASGRGRS